LQSIAGGKVFEVVVKESRYFGVALILAHFTFTNQSFI
jgi:hypothetical protein